MADNDSKNDQMLKKAQVIIAILAGLATFIVGAYNAKKIFFKDGPGSVAITVLSEKGQPVSNATIQILNVNGGVVDGSAAGPDGKYKQKLDPESYTLKVSKVGFQPEALYFSVAPGKATQVNVKLQTAASSIRSTVEEVGASWIKKLGSPRDTPAGTATQ